MPGAREGRVLQSRRQRRDRIGLAMVEDMERQGRLKPGGTIVECTSGNTGLGLAMVAVARGYRAALCMPDKVSSEKVSLLRRSAPKCSLSPTAVEPTHPDSYYSVAKRIASERPGAVLMNQYHNPANPARTTRRRAPRSGSRRRARSRTSWPGMGTGGTITGIGRYLRSRTRRCRSSAPIPWARSSSTTRKRARCPRRTPTRSRGVGEGLHSLGARLLRRGQRDPVQRPRRAQHGAPSRARGRHLRRRLGGHGHVVRVPGGPGRGPGLAGRRAAARHGRALP